MLGGSWASCTRKPPLKDPGGTPEDSKSALLDAKLDQGWAKLVPSWPKMGAMLGHLGAVLGNLEASLLHDFFFFKDL